MKKINRITVLIITIFILCIGMFTACSLEQEQDTDTFQSNVSTVGVWWWHVELGDEYLEFAAKNGVTEIYWGGSTSTLAEFAPAFIEKAGTKNIAVYLLLGTYEWIHNDEGFNKRMERFNSYQAMATEDNKFAGVHLDVEPQQDPLWKNRDNRLELLQKYLDFVVKARNTYPNVHLDFDIPAWFNDLVDYKGAQIELYKAIIQEANRVFIMSYRDTAEGMVNFSTVKQQVEYAKSLNKQIFLSAECSAPDEDGTVISFVNKGKLAMYEELNKLRELTEFSDLGISIHHIRTWYDLKN